MEKLSKTEKENLEQRTVHLSFNPWYREIVIHYCTRNGHFQARQSFKSLENKINRDKVYWAVIFADNTRMQFLFPCKLKTNSFAEIWLPKVGKGIEDVFYMPDPKQIFHLDVRQVSKFQLSKTNVLIFGLMFRKGYEDQFRTCDYFPPKTSRHRT